MIKIQTTTPYIIYAQIGFSTNRQTFNNNFATAEKSLIFKPHKLYTNTLAKIAELNFGGEMFIKIIEKKQIETVRF